ncbi:hypothetical protein OEA41_001587 [Lepraria neglecta]|uniref:Stress response RCI peptide n=1 Tax=Lepraria neglecta TaxID=209136 RepID=A0AAD9ZDG2_9LECA|nr:hypothetical protein OEA41_001587 [Lepraria neglecta]
MCSSDIFLGLLAILFPPIAVWIKSGICSADSLINILLCVLGYIPGLIHAWYIISLYPEPSDYEYETIPQDQGENGSVTYYYVNHRPSGEALMQQGSPQRPHTYVSGPQQARGYGTTDGRNAPPQQQQAGEGSAEGGVPPSYEQVIKGDHKVQT